MYAGFARFYDRVQGTTPVSFARWIVKEVDRLGVPVASILELGSGTGAVLENLPNSWLKTGVDISPEMLAEASKKQLDADLVHGDIRSLRMERTFSVVACVYDTLNHLRPAEWLAVFQTAALHLAPGGVFLFDINTLGRLQQGVTAGESIIEDDPVSTSIQIREDSPQSFVWRVQVLLKEPGSQERMIEEITEYGRPIDEVCTELMEAGFSSVQCSAGTGRAVNDEAPRVFFTCQR